MTAKQILDAFSETLMQDARILSPREQELLTSILQNSRLVSSGNPEIQSAVTAAIGRSVGETIAQRAFVLLGGSIVEQILAGSGTAAGAAETMPANLAELRTPQPSSMAPEPPSSPQPPSMVPPPPDKSPHKPGHVPQHPGSPKPPGKPEPAKSPQPPSGPGGMRTLNVPAQQQAQRSPVDSIGIGVLEAPAPVRAQCVVLDEFLAPQELNELVDFTLQHEAEFQSSEVISPSGDPGVVDYNHRRSRVLMDLGRHEQIILERIRGVLPRVLDQLGVKEFPVRHVETQITASNDGDFFGEHRDDAQEMIASRNITFVYFFHREPRQFEGGELRLHDSRWHGEQQVKICGYQSIVPRQNQIVFFPCSLLHEITPVDCASRAFADSRFTLNGWLHN
jgi:Rps23 Pro-64 3,4-dihydroxylase Tpa1-like proline 4-hydroxylase